MADPGGGRDPGRLVLPGVFVSTCAVSGALGPLDEAPAFLALAAGMAAWGFASGPGVLRKLAALAGIPAIAVAATVETRLALMAACVLFTRAPVRPACTALVCGALAWRLAVTRLAVLWMASCGVSGWLSAAAGAWIRRPLDLGPSVSGLDLLILLAIGLAAGRPGGRGGTAGRGIAGVAAVMAWLVCCASGLPVRAGPPFAAPALFNMAHEHLTPAPADATRAMLCWLPVLGLVMAALLAGRPRPAEHPGSWPRMATVALSALLFAALFLPARAPAGRRAGDLLLLKSPAFDLDVPRADRPGIASAGMFGLLGRYLALDGHRLRVHEGPLTAASLRGASVVVAPVPTLAPRLRELRRLQRFVESGGSLLVLADHTDLMGTMKATNALTGRWGIRARFDSAYPAAREWTGCLDRFPGAPAGHAGIGTGASLDVRFPARPLLMGRYALSDRGDRANGGRGAFLGDYAYAPGERFGDLPVAAIARPGRGRVVVFGDTSSFQNVVLPYSYPFVADLLDDLARPADTHAGRTEIAAGLLGLALGLLGFAGCRLAPIGLTAAVTAAALAAPTGPGPLQRVAPDAPVALVDAAHMNAYATHLWHERSIGGLIVNLQRDGYLPLVVRRRLAARMSPSSLPVIVSPRTPLLSAEAEAIGSHLDAGGTVLVAAGRDQRDAVAPLLAAYGLSLGDLPLGPVPIVPDMDREALERALRRPQFRSAWPVHSRGLVRTRSLFRAFGRDIVVEASIEGKGGARGRLLVIADPDFLTDRVLENETQAWEGNTALLASLLSPEGGS